MKTTSALLLAVLLAMPAWAADDSSERQYQELVSALQRLDVEAGDTGHGAVERLHVRQALQSYPEVRSRDRERALAAADLLLQTADYAVKTGYLRSQLTALESERAAILVEASRRDAELARKEADRLRLAALAREEEQAMVLNGMGVDVPAETTKVLTEAEAKDAELARLEEELSEQVAARGALVRQTNLQGKPGYLLSASAFKPGKAVLNSEARQDLMALAATVKSGGKAWLIVGYTDNLGSEAVNLQLSRQRAEAVKAVLKSAGIPAGKLSTKGMGSSNPIASNASKSGRAQNRRVEIIQK